MGAGGLGSACVHDTSSVSRGGEAEGGPGGGTLAEDGGGP